MGVGRDVHVGFKAIRLGFDVDVDSSTENGRAVNDVKTEKSGKLTEG